MREWTGMEFSKSHRTAENRRNWSKLVAVIHIIVLPTPNVRLMRLLGERSSRELC